MEDNKVNSDAAHDAAPRAGAKHPAGDRLLAEIRLSGERLERFVARARDTAEPVGSALRDQAAMLIERAGELRDSVNGTSAEEVELGLAVADLGSAVDTLEADADAATDSEPSNYQEVVDRQIRAWRGRIDQLRVRGSLGAMEARDELESLGQRLDHARGGALVELQQAAGDSKEIVADLREDVEEVLVDVRRAVERAASAITHR